MNKINWALSPKGAEFFAFGRFRMELIGKYPRPFVFNNREGWKDGIYTKEECFNADDFEMKPKKIGE